MIDNLIFLIKIVFIIWFVFGFWILFFKINFFYLKKKALREEKIKTELDLLKWRDIPEFDSKDDIELYLKNKSENDKKIEYKIEQKHIYNSDLLKKLYVTFGSFCHDAYINGSSEDRQEIENRLIQFERIKDISSFNITRSGGQQKTKFFESESINKVFESESINKAEQEIIDDEIMKKNQYMRDCFYIPPPPPKPEPLKIRFIKDI